jgi:hypothetical protein
MESHMERENIYGKTVLITKDNFIKDLDKDMENGMNLTR